MLDGRDQRRDPRVPLVLRVDYPGLPQAVRDATENLSAGGLLIRTDRELVAGERVPLVVSFPGLLDPLEVEVDVVRRRPAGEAGPSGVAVKIPIDRVDDRHKLARLVETARTSLGRSRRAFRVLVVEDDPRLVERYEDALRKLRSSTAGVEVAVEYAQNGQEALDRLEEPLRIDLVITGLDLPVLDGVSLVERLRANPELAFVAVLVIGAGGPEARQRAVELGVDVYLEKPVQFGDIISTVRTLLEIKA